MAIAATAAVVLGLGAGAAHAQSSSPNPGYEEFHGCPNTPDVLTCVRIVVDGGHLKLGATDTPINVPIELNGGLKAGGQEMAFTSSGGLTSPRLRVPGGLTGLTGFTWLEDLFPHDLLKVFARPILVGTPTNPFGEPFQLKLKIRLENPLLSANCFIGSDADPIVLEQTKLTTSPPPPNQPISGQVPTLSIDSDLLGVTNLTDGKVVDNAFAAPKAKNCSFLGPFSPGLIDAIVNLRAGLPSPAGTNTSEMTFDGRSVARRFVYATTP
jgi:hypothetical protein